MIDPSGLTQDEVAAGMGLERVDQYLVDLSKTRFICTAYPDHRWPVQLMMWIEGLMQDIDHRPDYRDSLNKKNMVCARNTAILASALGSHPSFEWFIFVDHDVKPDWRSTPFLELQSDIKCCQVTQNSPYCYGWPDSFHDALWCTSRAVLEAIGPPYFWIDYNDNKTDMLHCMCESFRQKALAAGFSISHGGYAEHDRDASWCS